MSSPLLRALRRTRRAATRRIRRALRRRLRTMIRAHQARQTRKAEARRRLEQAAATGAPVLRTLTGKPLSTPPPTTMTPTRKAAPMSQRVKRSKDGKFDGSQGADATSAKKSAAKKSATAKKTASPAAAKKAASALAAKQAAAEARHLEKFRRDLDAGDQRAARTGRRIDRMTGH